MTPSPEFVFPSFAKINWTLKVLGKRPDGYHELHTVFQTVSLHDRLTFRVTQASDIRLTCTRTDLATDETNLVVRAALALRRESGVRAGAEIRLQKNIPTGAGLGGGSGDAAVTLLALNRLWGADLPDSVLHRLAAGLGADVPFFLHGGTALGTGRGDLITPLADIDAPFLLLANPGVEVPTGKIFGLFSSRLTSPDSVRILAASFFSPDHDIPRNAENDLEATVFETHPEVGAVRRELLDAGAVAARMSGSGATVFGVFETEEKRQSALEHPMLRRRRIWSCRTVARNEYREAFKALSGR